MIIMMFCALDSEGQYRLGPKLPCVKSHRDISSNECLQQHGILKRIKFLVTFAVDNYNDRGGNNGGDNKDGDGQFE